MDSPTAAASTSRYRIVYEGRTPEIRMPLRSSRWAPLGTLVVMASAVMRSLHWLHRDKPIGWDAIFLAIEALGFSIALAGLLSELFCTETLRVFEGILEVRMGVGPIARTWRYRTSEISRLQGWNGPNKHDRPFFLRPSAGAVTFEYRGKTIYLAPAVDEEEGAVIADWLGRRLPRSATVFE
jgi:hypothetical protein